MTDPTSELLDRLFSAIERGDVDTVAGLYADDVEVWHNVTGEVMGKQANLDLLRYWHGHVADMRYEVLERHTYEGGAMQRHVVHGHAGGETLAAHVAIVFRVDGGRITRIYEYLDPKAVAAVFDRSSDR
jgi:ketosteroid isomerase-like protein